ncbi:RING-type E3 ubiquitin transferase [Hirschfeldia incana]|nr:RING-type E3 ubiquitin transferase [Hirschfeldia incana]
MDLAAAALCIGLASLMRFSSSSKKMTCELLRRAITVNDLKGLGECLENNKIENPTVVVHGTVGSTSTVENSRMGVFIEERVSLKLKRMNLFVSAVPDSSSTISEKTASLELKRMNLLISAIPDSSSTISEETDSVEFERTNLFDSAEPGSKTIFVSRKEVPWYLITDTDCIKCCQVLEIGTYLTVVGRAVRDKDGAPTIGNAYQFFNGHIQLNELVNDLESGAEGLGNLSFCLTVLGTILLALNIMQTAVERSR